MAGLRVIRGPDWKLGDADGGEGHVGTIVGDPADGKVQVLWDSGQSSTLTLSSGSQVLFVLDNATIGE